MVKTMSPRVLGAVCRHSLLGRGWGRVKGFRWGPGGSREWGEGLILDLGISEAREINGFPPPNTHTPRDGLIQMTGGVRGRPKTRYQMPSPQGLSWWHRWGKEAKGQVSSKGQGSYLDDVNYSQSCLI